MAEFDPQQVVDTMRLDAAPKTWRVFRGEPFSYQLPGCLLAMVAIAMPACLGLSIGATILAGDMPDWGSLWFIAPFCALLGIPAIILFARAPALRERWIALTPNGVIEYRGPRKGIHVAAGYQNLAGITLGTSRWGPIINLDFKLLPGSPQPVHWTIPNTYLSPTQIAQAIIESHAVYVANHTAKQQEW